VALATMLDPVAVWTARLVLAAVFAMAAFAKLRSLEEFVGVVHNYRVLPESLVRPVAYALPPLELAIALALLLEPTRSAGAVSAAALLAVFALAMAANLARGRVEIDCGCFAATLRQRISWALVGRNLTLIALAALAMPTATVARVLTWLDAVTIAAASSSAVLLYVAFTQLRSMALPARPRPGGAR
jgi:uncharacterized membrane protein YphA (DoxX/SURF4 family)